MDDPEHIQVIPMTDEEITLAMIPPVVNKLAARQAALAAKWPDAFAMLDDVLIDLKQAGVILPVMKQRDAIKLANPKE